MKVNRGEYIVIRVDGTETVVQQRPTIPSVHREIGCTCTDQVILSKNRATGMAEIVMMVDDTGALDGKPVNPKATELYHAVSIPNNPHKIHGDVVIVHDEDFGGRMGW